MPAAPGCGLPFGQATGAEATWMVSVPVVGRVREAWNARWAQEGTRIVARGVDWNAHLAAAASTTWGFCADR